jgi:outer membrane immunogenic protein
MKFTLAVMALAMTMGGAAAADMPVKARPMAPVPSWAGFYVGVNGGVAGMDGPRMHFNDLAVNAYVPVNFDPSTTDAIGGFHAGYQWQFPSRWLLGIEGDWDWTNLRDSGSSRLTCAGPGRVQCGGVPVLFTDNATLQTDERWLASVRARVGYTWDQWLLYATGGVAFADLKFNAAVNCTNVQPSFCNGISQSISTQFSDTRAGWVLGAGLERKLSSNWSLGAEFLYYRFEETNSAGGSFVFSNGVPAPFFECTQAGQNCANFTYGHIGIGAGRARLTYRFGS